MIAVALTSAMVIVWVYAGYPLALKLLGRLRPGPDTSPRWSRRCR